MLPNKVNSVAKHPFIGIGFTFLGSLLLLFQNCSGQWHSKSNDSSFFTQNSADHSKPNLRRLSLAEMDRSIAATLGDQTKPATTWLPPDPRTPFDNDTQAQLISTPLIEGIEQMAVDVSSRFMSDTTRRNQILSCSPSGSGDSNCLLKIIQQFSLALFRQPFDTSSQNALLTYALSQAQSENNFYVGVDIVIRYLLQHPSFIYRFENSQIDNPSQTASAYEIASRLSFLIWGSGPDQDLLKAAAAGTLVTKEQRHNQALRLLADTKATKQIQTFHAMWLAYEKLPHESSLSQSMQNEANAMVERIVFTDNRPWIELLNIDQTRIDENLAAIYGLPTNNINNQNWITLPSNRRGILSTGAFLSVAPKFGDTSPTQRGKFIRERILCQKIPPPPPETNVDSPPPAVNGNNCKVARYEQHRLKGSSCFACHEQMDPIGFGLEQFDRLGQLRQYETLSDGTQNSSCPIEGNGTLAGIGHFSGPKELGQILIQSNQIPPCLIKQYYHFAYGQEATSQQNLYLDQLENKFATSGGKFKDLVLALVDSDEFILKVKTQ